MNAQRALPVDDLPACPVEVALRAIGHKWKVLIVRELLVGTRRFSELRTGIPGVSQKVLTANLRAMEDDGLLIRKAFAEVPPRVEYSLTEDGMSLAPVLDSLGAWGNSYRERREAKTSTT